MIDSKRNSNFYVITGGPGVGKTTLLHELKKRNQVVVSEVAREIIKEQQKINGEALPWKNIGLYKNMMFGRTIKSFVKAEEEYGGKAPVFFDRGFLDSFCYAGLVGLSIDERMERYAYKWRYNDGIFILPPWKEIYKTDNERKQGWDEAILTYEKMKETYHAYGYYLIEVPRRSVGERADFILNYLELNNPKQNTSTKGVDDV